MPNSAATGGNQESDDDASVDKAVLCASYQARKGTHFGSPWEGLVLGPSARVEAILVGCPTYLAQTVLGMSKPE
jgi:hypothetical protein